MCETFTCCSGEKLNTKLKINEYINKSKCRRRRRHKNEPRKQKETAKKNQNERNTKVLAQRAQQLPFTAAENSGPPAPLALSPSQTGPATQCGHQFIIHLRPLPPSLHRSARPPSFTASAWRGCYGNSIPLQRQMWAVIDLFVWLRHVHT